MNSLMDMLWIEARKALRSGMPLWTALGSLFMPLGIAFLIYVSKNPEISKNLGLVSAKANLVAFAATDWRLYLGLFGQMIAAGGFILFVLVTSWIFGREFVDGTLKDMLAVPVQRSSILLAKFLVMAAWSAGLAMIIYTVGLAMGAIIQLPGGSTSVIFQNSIPLAVCTLLTIVAVFPFAFIASAGRGYLLPIGAAVFILMLTNLVAVIGWGDYFPWGIPGLYVQGKIPLTPVNLSIVLLTGLAGMLLTDLWWKNADQSR
jgi:ABC-2 type transport system permease protein